MSKISEEELDLLNDHLGNKFCYHYQADSLKPLHIEPCILCESTTNVSIVCIYSGQKISLSDHGFEESTFDYYHSCRTKHNIEKSILLCRVCCKIHKKGQELQTVKLLGTCYNKSTDPLIITKYCDSPFCDRTDHNHKFFQIYLNKFEIDFKVSSNF